MICHPCKYQLEKSYQFKKKCEVADAKLRKHMNLIHQLTGQEDTEDQSRTEDIHEESEEPIKGKSNRVKQLLADLVSSKGNIVSGETDGEPIEVTEEELVGGYILGMGAENPDMEEGLSEDPENITLIPAEEKTAKARCTIRTTRIKQEQESEDEADEVQRAIAHAKNVYVMELSNSESGQADSLNLQSVDSATGKDETGLK